MCAAPSQPGPGAMQPAAGGRAGTAGLRGDFSSSASVSDHSTHAHLKGVLRLAAAGESFCCIPPLPLVGVLIGMWKGRQQNDSLADGYL